MHKHEDFLTKLKSALGDSKRLKWTSRGLPERPMKNSWNSPQNEKLDLVENKQQEISSKFELGIYWTIFYMQVYES